MSIENTVREHKTSLSLSSSDLGKDSSSIAPNHVHQISIFDLPPSQPSNLYPSLMQNYVPQSLRVHAAEHA